MLTAYDIAKIQSALDTLAAIPSAQRAGNAATLPLLDLHIKCYYCAPREYTEIGARKITRKVCSSQYEAVCDIDSLDVSATGATRAAALRNLFKAIRNAASLNAPTLRVPLVLCEPTKAKAEARAERKAERADAPTIIVAAAHDAAPGSEGIFKALLGLRTEEKIVALVNALHAAGVTIYRVEEDGFPIIRASMPDYHPEFGTCTVLNL